jgi:hypothetical protein
MDPFEDGSEGKHMHCSAYELEQSLLAVGMDRAVAKRLIREYDTGPVLYWLVRAEGKSNPSGFIRAMLTKNAPRASPPPERAESGEQRADRQAQALYERTKAESRARKEGRPPTEEEFGSAMSSLAACLPGAREEMARRGLLR